MIISDLALSVGDHGAQTLSARVTFETPTPKSFQVYFRFRNAPGELHSTADPFLMSFLASAMILGEDLEVRAPVDRELCRRIEWDIIPLLRRWFPFLPAVALRCEEQIAPASFEHRTRGAAAAFSGGLDAFYTAMRHRDTLRWLVAAQGFDSFSFRPKLWRSSARVIGAAAAAVPLPLLIAESNVREISHCEMVRTRAGKVPAGIYRLGPNGPIGPFLAALGRCTAPFSPRFLISASMTYDHLPAHGTHPLFDPMWSTSIHAVRHIGCELDRIEKLAWLNREAPHVLPFLRVCHQWTPGVPNCGKCEKCLRTMLEARFAGIDESVLVFAERLDLERVKDLTFQPLQAQFWEDIARLAGSAGEPAIARAATIALGRRFYLPRFLKRGFGAPRSEYDAAARWRRIRHRMAPAWRTRDDRRAPVSPGVSGSAGKPD